MAKKRVLVIGSGGREHAIVAALARSPQEPEIYCAPGNGGIASEARIVELAADSPEGIDHLVSFATSEGIDLTVVGPEAPLCMGIVDRFQEAGLAAFGPPAAGARLEGSKCFLKEFLARHEIPTASFEVFDDAQAARTWVEQGPIPIVVKADGLAAGKGVIVAASRDEALAAIDAIMVEKRFGDAGRRVVLEECLLGREISVFAITDGAHWIPLETAQDYKPAFDGGRGPNTGGMGSYSPFLSLGDPTVQRVLTEIIAPTVKGLRDEGIVFRGVLYAGVMITAQGPKLLEYNVRFGDPETQPILSRLRTDLLSVLEASLEDGGLERTVLDWDPRHAVCLVAASGGYPGSYRSGHEITGIDAAEALADVKVFHAGTRRDEAGRLVTSGGRVLGITALADTRPDARARAYEALERISFEDCQYRTDIAYEA